MNSKSPNDARKDKHLDKKLIHKKTTVPGNNQAPTPSFSKKPCFVLA
ncbi:hypothetical protein LJC59_10250 [Desulfovibrio sp. OttesenSCG-928-A18]|nr:hypothetical protein [Desulfovibrio sp. OttesenSCG-928-A18]